MSMSALMGAASTVFRELTTEVGILVTQAGPAVPVSKLLAKAAGLVLA